MWKSEVVEHKNFKDLGNYVIELPDFDDPAVLERSLAALNAGGEITKFGCTCFAKRNSKGEVVFGRNMDLDISQKCAYVYRTSFGKYKNICVTYSPGTYLNYDEVKQVEEIPQSEMDKFLCVACDALNEKGLYIQVDLREEKENTICYGLHTNNGEVTRADGTPWKDLRASTVAVTQLVSQNCATVAEAVEFVKNSYDWYTFTPAPGVSLGVNQNNFAFMIGDANGDYGLLEIAQDQVNFIPYQYGHANFYITPKWNALDPVGAGLGRLDWVSKVITPVETLEEAMQSLRQGDLDAVLCDDAPAAVFVGRYQSLRVLDEVFMEEDYAGIVAKERVGLLDTVNVAIIQMRSMGVFDSVFHSYIGGSGKYRFKPDTVTGPVLRLATNAEFPPYEFRAADGFAGIDIEIARYIADFMERPLEIVDMGFDSIIDAVRLGRADIGLAAFSVTEEREKLISFTDTYAKSKIVVVVRSDEDESLMTFLKDSLFGE